MPRTINVQSESGAAVPSASIPASFRGEAGLGEWSTQGLSSDVGPQCGDSVIVKGSAGQTAYGRLMVFQYQPGSGPAGRGDYRIEVPDARIDSAVAGRLTVHVELYKNNGDGGIMTAWAVVMHDHPLPCSGAQPGASYDAHQAAVADRMAAVGVPPAPAAAPAPAPAPASPNPPAAENECRMAAAHASTLARTEVNALVATAEPLAPADRQALLAAQVPGDIGVQAGRVLAKPPGQRDALLAEIYAKFAADTRRAYVDSCHNYKAPFVRCALRAMSLAQQEACAMDPSNW